MPTSNIAGGRRVSISAPEKDQKQKTSGYEPPSQRLRYLSKSSLPESLDALGSRYDSLSQVIQYLEESHMSAVAGEGGDRNSVEVEARSYLVEALLNITSDIDLAAANLEQIIELQTGAVDSLTNQVDLVRSQINHAKETDHVTSLHDMMETRVSHNTKRSMGGGGATNSNNLVPEVASRETKQGDLFYYPSFVRIPMEQRLQALDDVGLLIGGKKKDVI